MQYLRLRRSRHCQRDCLLLLRMPPPRLAPEDFHIDAASLGIPNLQRGRCSIFLIAKGSLFLTFASLTLRKSTDHVSQKKPRVETSIWSLALPEHKPCNCINSSDLNRKFKIIKLHEEKAATKIKQNRKGFRPVHFSAKAKHGYRKVEKETNLRPEVVISLAVATTNGIVPAKAAGSEFGLAAGCSAVKRRLARSRVRQHSALSSAIATGIG